MRATYITDFGAPIEMVADTGETTMLSRYGVWQWDGARGKHQVVCVDDDLNKLQQQYGPCEVVLFPPRTR